MSTLSCPACSTRLSWKDISFAQPFRCPECQRDLRVSTLYPRVIVWVSLLIAGLSAYIVGLRDFFWLIVLFLGFLPIGVIVSSVIRRMFPPKIHIATTAALNFGIARASKHDLCDNRERE